jgi:hypothetical protein
MYDSGYGCALLKVDKKMDERIGMIKKVDSGIMRE